MNEQRQIEELAKIEFGESYLYMVGLTVNLRGKRDAHTRQVKHAYTSLDALQPLLLGMSDVQRCEVYRHVSRLCNFYVLGDIFKATPARIAEAILREFNVWENEEKGEG